MTDKVDIFAAIRDKNLQALRESLWDGIDINKGDRYGKTPLIMACECKWLAGVKVLVGAGVNLEGQERKNQRTALISSVRASSRMCVRYLIRIGANINAVDAIGGTALMWSCVDSKGGLTDFLIEKGACIDPITIFGHSALMTAAKWGNKGAMMALMKIGADLEVQNNENKKIDHYLIRYPELLELLREERKRRAAQQSLRELQKEVAGFGKPVSQGGRKI